MIIAVLEEGGTASEVLLLLVVPLETSFGDIQEPA